MPQRRRVGQSKGDIASQLGTRGTNRSYPNVELPATFKCINCATSKPKDQFSNKQLADFRSRLAVQPAAAIHIRCKTCNSGQAFELHCALCDRTKAITEFSRAQRSRPDSAHCLECVRQIAETDAGRPVAKARPLHYDSDDEDFGDSDSDASNPYETEGVSVSGAGASVRSGATSSAAPQGYIPQPRQSYAVSEASWEGSDAFYGTASSVASGSTTRASRWAKAKQPEKEDYKIALSDDEERYGEESDESEGFI